MQARVRYLHADKSFLMNLRLLAQAKPIRKGTNPAKSRKYPICDVTKMVSLTGSICIWMLAHPIERFEACPQRRWGRRSRRWLQRGRGVNMCIRTDVQKEPVQTHRVEEEQPDNNDDISDQRRSENPSPTVDGIDRCCRS